jgi:hypothetical protein
MERVETLLQKLQQQLKDKATPAQMLLTVQMLQHELIALQGAVTFKSSSVEISMPFPNQEIKPERNEIEIKEPAEERIVEVLQVDDAEIEAELEEIRKNAANIQKISVQSKPQLLFESMDDDIPTLHLHNVVKSEPKEINDTVAKETGSFNEKLKESKTEISEVLTESPIRDLKKAIGLNDRYLFINELFRGDEAMYERSIKTINGFSIWPEAEYWIRRELKTKLGWTDSQETVKQFDQLIRRRFS